MKNYTLQYGVRYNLVQIILKKYVKLVFYLAADKKTKQDKKPTQHINASDLPTKTRSKVQKDGKLKRKKN